MKKAVSLILALAMMLTAAAALAETFRQGIDPVYDPFSYMDEKGEYIGFDVELCKAVCDLNGWEQELVPIDWDAKLISLNANEHDCIWSGMTLTKEMAEQGFVLSFAYYDNYQVILTKKDSGIESSKDLAGKRVAVQRGTSGAQLLEDPEGQLELAKTFDGGAPVLMDDFNICALELDAGSADAVIVDIPVAKRLAEKYEGFVVLEENLGSEQYGICFRAGDEELCKKVEEALMKLVEDGTYLALAQKYELDESVMCLLPKAE